MTRVYVVQTNTKVIRALPAHDHRPGRPGPRSHLRLWHDRLRRRAVGPPLDHLRHLARVAVTLAKQRLMTALLRLLRAGTSRGRRGQRLPLQDGAARHAEEHRQQSRDRDGMTASRLTRHREYADQETLYDQPYVDTPRRASRGRSRSRRCLLPP